MRAGTTAADREGIVAAEVLVIVGIVALIVLMLMASLPRRRESARAVACRENLRQIGQALILYAEAERVLPGIPALGPFDSPKQPGPLDEVREALGVANFLGLGDPERPPPRGSLNASGIVAGWTCPSDPGATSGRFASPVSYRAVAGSGPEGSDGPFAPGRRVTPVDVEAGDGLAFTAAFGERVVGSGGSPSPTFPGDYALLPGPLSTTGPLTLPPDVWKADAGSSWAVADWRSTLMNHSLPPGGGSSAVAHDGQTARMGASAGHGGFVHVLLLDGSVQPYAYQTDPKVWRGLASFKDEVEARVGTAGGPSAGGSVPKP